MAEAVERCQGSHWAPTSICQGYLSMQSNRRFFVAATTDKSEANRIKKEPRQDTEDIEVVPHNHGECVLAPDDADAKYHQIESSTGVVVWYI